jgi:nitroreductase
LNSDTGIPETVHNAENMCLDCGHCIAVCPYGALSLTSMKVEECQSISQNFNPGIEIIEYYFKSRRSIRRFKNKTVEKEKLEKLLDITAYAPTGHNSRTVEFIVYTQKEEIKKLTEHVIDWMQLMISSSPDIGKSMHFDMITKAWASGVDVVMHNAPVVIVAHGNKNNPNTPTSCTIALAHLELIAQAFGLWCCWAGYFTWCAMAYPPLREALSIPDDNGIYGTILTGYPIAKYYRIPKRKALVEWR